MKQMKAIIQLSKSSERLLRGQRYLSQEKPRYSNFEYEVDIPIAHIENALDIIDEIEKEYEKRKKRKEKIHKLIETLAMLAIAIAIWFVVIPSVL